LKIAKLNIVTLTRALLFLEQGTTWASLNFTGNLSKEIDLFTSSDIGFAIFGFAILL
jgi:hypothetical protein